MKTKNRIKHHLHEQVTQKLRERIFSHRLSNGSKPFTATTVLAEEFSVSMPTIRQSIGNLTNEGFLDTHQGRGTFLSKEFIKGSKTIALTWSPASDLEMKSPWHKSVFKYCCEYIESKGYFFRHYPLHDFNRGN